MTDTHAAGESGITWLGRCTVTFGATQESCCSEHPPCCRNPFTETSLRMLCGKCWPQPGIEPGDRIYPIAGRCAMATVIFVPYRRSPIVGHQAGLLSCAPQIPLMSITLNITPLACLTTVINTYYYLPSERSKSNLRKRGHCPPRYVNCVTCGRQATQKTIQFGTRE